MKNQSVTIKTNPKLYSVVMGGSGGYRRLPARSDHFSWHTDRHIIIIYISSPSSPGANSDGPRSRLAKISSHAGEDLEHHPMIHRHGWFWWSSCSWCSLWWWSFWDSGELRIGIEEPHEGDACMHICILYISFSMERRQAYFDQPFCPQIPSLIGFCSIILPPQ